MEELLAYAYLLGMDLFSETIYEEKLNELFLENPTDEDLLELEFLSGKMEETIDPLSWKDVEQTRKIYEHMLNCYER